MKDSKRKEDKDRVFAWMYGQQDEGLEKIQKQFAESIRKRMYEEECRLFGIQPDDEITVTAENTTDPLTVHATYIVVDDVDVIDLDPSDWREVPIPKQLLAGKEE